MSRKSGRLNLLEPSGPHRACYGTPPLQNYWLLLGRSWFMLCLFCWRNQLTPEFCVTVNFCQHFVTVFGNDCIVAISRKKFEKKFPSQIFFSPSDICNRKLWNILFFCVGVRPGAYVRPHIYIYIYLCQAEYIFISDLLTFKAYWLREAPPV